MSPRFRPDWNSRFGAICLLGGATAFDAQRASDFLLACEREGKRHESYALKLHESKTGEDGECTLPEGAWARYKVGDRCSADVGAVLGNIDCKSLEKR